MLVIFIPPDSPEPDPDSRAPNTVPKTRPPGKTFRQKETPQGRRTERARTFPGPGYARPVHLLSIDGVIAQADRALLPALDAGLQHGVGLFETLAAGVSASGKAWLLHPERHMERLLRSANELRLCRTLDADRLTNDAIALVEEAGRSAGPGSLRVRITVTGGDTNLLRGRPDASTPTSDHRVVIGVQPGVEYPPDLFERGVAVVIAGFRANPLDPCQGHKTLSYWPRLLELRQAATRRAAEALVFQVTNYLAGGCVSNCLLVKDGTVITPIAHGEEGGATEGQAPSGQEEKGRAAPGTPQAPGIVLPSPVLPGTVRAWALDWAESRGMDVERRLVGIDDVLRADEVLLTNSGWGVVPVVKVEGEAIADAVPGEFARSLREAWLDLLESAGAPDADL
jgi:branched-subunit amino acid aminotransferase/4-amino-4-deoxychorismate lyase